MLIQTNLLQDINTMSSSPSVCGLCDIRHICKQSELWCPECDEELCIDCAEHHSLSKASRNHKTIPISEYRKLPSNVLKIREFCNEHDERFQTYCKKHCCPCCRICIVESHNECKDITVLEDVVEGVKSSHMFKEIESFIDEMIENVGKIRQSRETNSAAVTEQKQMIECEIRELRTNVNNHLDKLEEDLMKELTEAETTITEKTCELMVSLDEKEKVLTECQTNVVNIKQYASDLQTFLVMKQIENDVETLDTSLHALVNSDSLNQTKLSCKIDTTLKNITTSIDRFEEVVVESKPCELTFVRKKDKQAQMMVADLPPMSVDNIQLNMKQKINTKGALMRGCSLLPDGRMVFSCYSKHIVRFIDKDGVELFKIGKQKKGFSTYDTVYLKDSNSVAVSSGVVGKRCITIIDIEKKKIMSTISINTVIYSMAVRDRTVYYCAENNGLKMINLSDKSVSNIINSNISCVDYVATFRDKLYYTSYNTHTVTCCDLHGTTQWEFKDERVLQGACGISVDNDENVYVVGYCSNSVVVISSDGQRHRQLLSNKDGLVNPTVLDYDRSTNRLLVVNYRDTAFLFDVTWLQ